MDERIVVRTDPRDASANAIVDRYMLWAAGVGLVPVPYLDMLAVSAVQLKMVKELSINYGVEFSEERGKAIISSLLGGVVTGMVARSGVVKTALFAIPFIGPATAILSMSIFATASTYAVGRVFIQHFASGGTFLNFEPEKAREFFSEQYEKGKRFVTRRPAHEPEAPATPA
jgi:uncharacterized protein (DUF697 family)